ncbi:hypothetical protein NLX67_15010 [Domibacillus sp. A3M-37]|uniref:hypothetical protein n=1 Tax=Domibacillus sp. A3M-37 TaxID=2962037 RepID=UPI0020B692A1|nr:hypothetical protein [Domibacillus sp. A3M-37]MCP3763684.1 hypothetical protein [Domibacillus sp. A3M-37]
MIKNAVNIFFSILFVAGCANANTSDGAYAAIVRIDGENYVAQDLVANDEFTVKEQVGEVQQVTDNMPEDDWSANAFEKGNKIYSVNEKDNIFLIEENEGQYTILKEKENETE